MGKSSPEPSKPHQGPQFGLQEQLLSSTVMGNMLGQNPALLNLLGSSPQYAQQAQQAGFVSPGQVTGTSGGSMPVWNPGWGGGATRYPAAQPAHDFKGPQGRQFSQGVKPQQFGELTGRASGLGQTGAVMQGGGGFGGGYGGGPQVNADLLSSFRPQGFQYAGQPIAGQMTPNTTTGRPATTTGAGMRFNPYQFFDPGANFTQRTPFQFGQTPSVNVADIYTPQMDIARRDIEEMGGRQREAILNDMNRRGMLTSGAANRAVELQFQEQNRKLSDLASQYSIEQGRAQLQEDQLRRQMDLQRQMSQAEEIFRQMGASDEQAKYLATQNVNLQNAQAGQNLSAFGANLGAQQQQYGQGLSNAQLLLGQQGQQFQQALQGRQQATAEEQLANLFRRQPIEDLFRMWQQQAGPTGPTEGSSGILGMLGPIAGAAIGLI